VVPLVPVRQLVLTSPIHLRFLVARDALVFDGPKLVVWNLVDRPQQPA